MGVLEVERAQRNLQRHRATDRTHDRTQDALMTNAKKRSLSRLINEFLVTVLFCTGISFIVRGIIEDRTLLHMSGYMTGVVLTLLSIRMMITLHLNTFFPELIAGKLDETETPK